MFTARFPLATSVFLFKPIIVWQLMLIYAALFLLNNKETVRKYKLANIQELLLRCSYIFAKD